MKKKVFIKKKFLFYCILIISLFLIIFILAEVSLRILGHKPASPKYRLNIKVEPSGKYFKKDSLLGYTHLPGKFYVTLNNNYTFVTTHKNNTLRITHPIADDSYYIDKAKIWIMGCSFTHGWSINDDETYPWLIQEMYKDNYEIINFGCSGYGTIHSLIQIEEALKIIEKPKIIIYTYSSIHDHRNTFLLKRRKSVTRWNFLGPLSQPYATYNKKEGLQIYKADTIEYKGLPFNNYFALINFIEKVYLYFEDKFANDHDVSKALILKINEICKKNEIMFILAGIDSYNLSETQEMIDFCKSLDIYAVDISVDHNIPGTMNLPHDGHPSPTANKKYAKKLSDYLNSLK